MKIDNIDVKKTLDEAKQLLDKEENLSVAFRTVINILLMLVAALLERFSLNSSNSSKPPSTDPDGKKKKKKRKPTDKKPGGQKGHKGAQLNPVENPDEIENIKIDRRTLPKGKYQEVGFESRQVFDFTISVIVTEYRAQILENEHGEQYVAQFPEHVTRPTQYGPKTQATAVYLSQYQLLPYGRVEDHFHSQIGLPLSTGSLYNFNQNAYQALEDFEIIAKQRLLDSPVINADETGININGKRHWLHTACNEQWTHFYPHVKRGTEAINAIGIIPNYTGTLCHDHWKPYYTYTSCDHSLCNAHHLRELTCAIENDEQQWANAMHDFLSVVNIQVDEAGGMLSDEDAEIRQKEYDDILAAGDTECPAPIRKPGQKGRLKRTKSRNLLERLRNFKGDVLRFMSDVNVDFTNNRGENDLRMTKVQQKISGCFRSMKGAYAFCRIRAYLLTCQKHNINPTDALELLFKGELPDFVKLE